MSQTEQVEIGVLADTHVYDTETTIPQQLVNALKTVDFIIHAGDISTPSVLDELEKIAPVKAVLGNKIDDQLNFASKLPEELCLTVNGVRILVTHGHTGPEKSFEGYLGKDRSKHNILQQLAYKVKKATKKIGFKTHSNHLIVHRLKGHLGNEIDCVIFGHTHVPYAKRIDGILFFNPGDAQYTRKDSISLGILHVKKGVVTHDLIGINLRNEKR